MNFLIPDKKLSDNEIIKALELCGSEYECHNGCPYYNNGQFKCRDLSIYRDALSLINRLQEKNSNLTSDLTSLRNDLISAKAEIERLQSTVDSFTCIGKMYSEIKAEAYKEFAERLCAITKAIPEMKAYSIRENDLDNLLKEMVGENK